MHRHFFFACFFASLALVPASADETTQADEQALQAVGLRPDGASLLRFFHLRTAGETKPDHLTELLRQLGDKSASVREKATAELVSLGIVAVPWLRQASKDPDDLETASRARNCLEHIQGGSG